MCPEPCEGFVEGHVLEQEELWTVRPALALAPFLGRVMTPNVADLCLLHLSNQFSPLSGHILMVIFIQSSV